MAKRTRSRATPGAALLADAAPAKKQKGGSAVDVVARAADGAAAALPQSAQENEYEQARQAQIERNKERLQALQLQALAASVLPPAPPRRAAAKKSQAKRAARAQALVEPRRSLRQRGVASDGVSVVEELRGGAVTTNILLPAEPAVPRERHPKGEVALEDSDGAGPDAAFLSELRARAEGSAEQPSVQQVAKWRCGEDDIAKARGLLAQRVVTSGVVHLQFHPTTAAPVLAAADKAGHVALWAVGRGEDGVIECSPHYSYVCGLKWAGDQLVTASYDGSVRVLDAGASPGAFRLALSDEEAEFSALDVAPDSLTAYLGDKDGGLTTLDLRAAGRAGGAGAALHERKINTLHVEPGGRQELLSASADGSLALWDLRRLGPKAKALATAGHSYTCQSAYFAPDGSRRVVSTSRDDTLKIWGGAKGLQQLVSIRHYNNTGRWVSPFRAVWTPASDGVIVGNMKRTVDVFDAAGEQRAALSSEFQTAISPRNIMHPRLPLLAAATASGRVHLYS